MTFWILSLALAAFLGIVLARPLLRGGTGRTEAEADLQVYRDQLKEIDRDATRGVIAAAEAERARIEISRRLLDADRAGKAEDGTSRGSPVVPLVLLAATLLGGVMLYRATGAPGYPDLPIAERVARAEAFRAERPSQAGAEAEAAAGQPEQPAPDPQYAALMERLRKAVAEKPDDLTGQRLLARNEAALGNYAAAHAAQAEVIALSGADVTATDHATLADFLILAADGYVSPEADAALARALELDPANGTARFYTGLMWAQTGRPDLAFRLWRGLLDEGPEDAPWIAPIRSQIGMLASAAGVDYTPPAAPGAGPGPDAAQVAAAADLSDAERQEMVRSMVDRLADRLAAEGGPAEDWARLVNALGVIGDTERAAAVYAEAREVFTGRDADLAMIRDAAAQAGVAE